MAGALGHEQGREFARTGALVDLEALASRHMDFFPPKDRSAPAEVYALVMQALAGHDHPRVTAVELTSNRAPSLFHNGHQTHTRVVYDGTVRFLIPERHLRGWSPGQPLPRVVEGDVARLAALATNGDGGKARHRAVRNGPFAKGAAIVATGLTAVFGAAGLGGAVTGAASGPGLWLAAFVTASIAAVAAGEARRARRTVSAEDALATQKAVTLARHGEPVAESIGAETPAGTLREPRRTRQLQGHVREATNRLGAPPPPAAAAPGRRGAGGPPPGPTKAA